MFSFTVCPNTYSSTSTQLFWLLQTAFIFYIKAQLPHQPFQARFKYVNNQFDDQNIQDNSRTVQKYEEIWVYVACRDVWSKVTRQNMHCNSHDFVIWMSDLCSKCPLIGFYKIQTKEIKCRQFSPSPCLFAEPEAVSKHSVSLWIGYSEMTFNKSWRTPK